MGLNGAIVKLGYWVKFFICSAELQYVLQVREHLRKEPDLLSNQSTFTMT